MKRVLIIHTGGTFGMTPAEPTTTLKPGKIDKQIDTYIPRLRENVDISIKIPFNLDSSNIGPEEWKTLYTIIRNQINDYDGIVIIHGTDTLVYTASALSFLLLDIQKPVILTGSQRPLSAIRTDARANLINSVELATYDIPEVFVCFGNYLLRGNRTKKMSIESFQSFESPNYPPLANIGMNVSINDRYICQEKANIPLKPFFSENILSLGIYPGLQPEIYYTLLSDSVKAIVIEGFGSGNLPTTGVDWISFIAKAVDKEILVYLGSQSSHGFTDLTNYSCGQKALDAGAASLADMTTEAAIVKLMLLFGNGYERERIGELMNLSFAGEISQNN
jgi:L-asparaginase